MGQIISMAALYCCGTAASSLCNACFGTVAVGTTGRKRSVLLLAMVIATSLWFQYSIGPGILEQDGWIWKLLQMGTGKYLYRAWYESCEAQYPSSFEGVLEKCAGNAGVLRPTFLSTLFFSVNAIATRFAPRLNREQWPAKYTLFGFVLLISVFINNDPIFTSFYLWLARFWAAIFVVLQQVILIDVAYNWNDDWVEKGLDMGSSIDHESHRTA